MVNLLATSKIQSNYQTTIPKEIRKNFSVEKGMLVEWSSLIYSRHTGFHPLFPFADGGKVT